MPNYIVMEKKPSKRAHKVTDVVMRFTRQKKFVPEKTFGHVYAAKVTELAGDAVELDMTEQVLVALKRRKIISGRRMVNLLGQHQREIRG